MTKMIKSASGSRVVVASNNDGTYNGVTTAGTKWTANLYVNCKAVVNPLGVESITLGDITLLRKTAKKLSVIEQWAKDILR